MNSRNNVRMSGAQKKVMLNHLGVPYDDIPKRIGDIDPLLEAFMKNDREQYERTYDLIVNCKLPDGGSTQDKGYLGIAELIRDYLEPQSQSVEREYKDRLKGLEHRLDETIKVANKNKASVMNGFEDQAKALMKTLGDNGKAILDSVKDVLNKEISEAAKRYERIEIKVGESKPVDFDGEILHEDFEKIIQLASNRVNVMMVGPAGCGKTHLAGQVGKALNLDHAAQSCSAGMSESQLAGWLIPTGDNGQFVYVSSEFVRIYENGGVFLFDEIDAADPNVLIFINSAIANDGFFLPQRHKKPHVKKHEDFVALAAANTFGGGADAVYTARNALDGATLDRFRLGMIGMDYSEPLEEKLIDEDVLKLGRKLREIIEVKKLRKILSTRFMIDATKMKRNCDWTLKQIYEQYVSDWSPEELKVANLPNAVDDILNPKPNVENDMDDYIKKDLESTVEVNSNITNDVSTSDPNIRDQLEILRKAVLSGGNY